MKRNENQQKNPHELVTKIGRRKEEKREQHPELIPVLFIESKRVSKMKAVEKIENKDLHSKKER